MANNRTIVGISVDDGADNGKVPSYNATTKIFDMSTAGSGDVVGPASSTDNAIVRYDGTTGKLVQDNTVLTITDAGVLNFATDASATARYIDIVDQTTLNTNGNGLQILGSKGNGTGAGGYVTIHAGDGGGSNGSGAGAIIEAGDAAGNGSGGDVYLQPGSSPSGTAGKIRFTDAVNGFDILFDLSNVSSNITISFPNGSTTLVGLTTSQTITNKRIQPKSSTAASGDITPNLATANVWQRTALSAALTINAPTGTPILGESLTFMLLDNGTARGITWDSAFTTRVMGAALPTTTVINKQLLITCYYNGTTWLCTSVSET